MHWWTSNRLKRQLRSSSEQKRESALREIAGAPDSRGIGVLVDFIDSVEPRSSSRERAIATLAAIPGIEAGAAIARVFETRHADLSNGEINACIDALACSADVSALDLLARFIDDVTVPKERRKRAVRALSATRADGAVQVLVKIVESRNADVAIEAAVTLGELGALATAAVDPLIASLDGPASPTDDYYTRYVYAPKYRHVVVCTLGKIGSARAVPGMIRQLKLGSAEAAAALDAIESSWRTRPEVTEVKRSLIASLPEDGWIAGVVLDRIDSGWRADKSVAAVMASVLADLPKYVAGRRPGLESRIWAAGQLGDAKDEQLIDLLIQAQHCGTPTAQRLATMALERMAPEHMARDAARAATLLDVIQSSAEKRERVRAFTNLAKLLHAEDNGERQRRASEKTEAALTRMRGVDLQRMSTLAGFAYSFETTHDEEPRTIDTQTRPQWIRAFASEELKNRTALDQ